MSNRILLIDTSAILHLAKHSLPKTKLSAKRIKSGILYGFLLKLQMIMTKTQPTITVFALDDKITYRHALYKPYKQNRTKNKTPEEKLFDDLAYEQFNIIVQKVLPMLGYKNLLLAPKLEADDVIASICKQYTHAKIVIASNDQDLYQLLTNNVSMLNLKKVRIYSKNDFIDEYGILPHIWKRIKATAGCNSDNVQGVNKVGEKTAIKFYKGELPEHHKTYKDIVSEEGRAIINRNKSLVILPFRGTPQFQLKPNKVTQKRLKKVAKKYDLKSVLYSLNDWHHKLKR